MLITRHVNSFPCAPGHYFKPLHRSKLAECTREPPRPLSVLRVALTVRHVNLLVCYWRAPTRMFCEGTF